MENSGYLLAAFGLIWAFVFGFVFVLLGKEKKLRQEVAQLKEALAETRPEER